MLPPLLAAEPPAREENPQPLPVVEEEEEQVKVGALLLTTLTIQ
jgi:hypothetical protein